MSDQAADNSKKGSDEIPAFRITEKKVDDSWKEEARREREAAARAGAAAQPAAREERASKPEAHAPQNREQPRPEPAAGELGQEGAEGAPPAKAGAGTSQESKVFMNFLAGLAQQALMQLGEIESPFSGQRELDLNGARYTLELLTVIQTKTKGNLSAEESQALTEAVRDLKMRYVEIANEVQRQMQAQVEKAGKGGKRPGPGGTIPGPGFGRRG